MSVRHYPRHQENSSSNIRTRHITIITLIILKSTASPIRKCLSRPTSHSACQETSECPLEQGSSSSLTNDSVSPQGMSLSVENYLSAEDTITDRLQKGAGGTMDRLLRLQDELDSLAETVATGQSDNSRS